MSRKQGRVEMTKQHALMMRGVLLWMEGQPEPNPLEIGVMTEIVERIENHAAHAGFVRTRIKNLGDRKPKNPALDRLAARSQRATWQLRNWTLEEVERLETLFCREYESIERIAELMDRSPLSIHSKVTNLRLRRKRPHTKGYTMPASYKENTVLEAARRLKEQRQRERVRDEGAAD